MPGFKSLPRPSKSSVIIEAGVAEHGQRRRTARQKSERTLASGAYPAEVRGFKSHPLHQKQLIDLAMFLVQFAKILGLEKGSELNVLDAKGIFRSKGNA